MMSRERVDSALETARLVKSGHTRSYVHAARELSDLVIDAADVIDRARQLAALVAQIEETGKMRQVGMSETTGHLAGVMIADAFNALTAAVKKLDGST